MEYIIIFSSKYFKEKSHCYKNTWKKLNDLWKVFFGGFFFFLIFCFFLNVHLPNVSYYKKLEKDDSYNNNNYLIAFLT